MEVFRTCSYLNVKGNIIQSVRETPWLFILQNSEQVRNKLNQKCLCITSYCITSANIHENQKQQLSWTFCSQKVTMCGCGFRDVTGQNIFSDAPIAIQGLLLLTVKLLSLRFLPLLQKTVKTLPRHFTDTVKTLHFSIKFSDKILVLILIYLPKPFGFKIVFILQTTLLNQWATSKKVLP